MMRPGSENNPDVHGLLYRYLFWGWLFKDMQATDPWQHGAARAHNMKQKIHLSAYLRRWTGLCCFHFLAGCLLEPSALFLAAICFCSFAISTCVLATAAVSWILLR